MAITPGVRLDSYEIVAPLGSGGMGDVWLARDLRLKRDVAIKILPPHLKANSDRVSRFEQEARAASALNHPNVCTIYSVGTAEDGRLFIAMEYIDGTTLRQWLASNRPTLRQTLDITVQIASALGAAHAAGVIHRDVKPENIMIRGDGLVKVLDFGLAKLDAAVADLPSAQTTHTALRTDCRVVMGTIAYMSPEQARGERLDTRTDIFSVGAVLYEIVTGRQAFSGTSTAVVHDAILNRRPTSALRVNPELPARFEDIVNKALEKDRDLRYQTISELRTDLMRLTRDLDARTLDAGTADSMSTGARLRPRRLAVALALLIAAILAVIALVPRGLRSLFRRSEFTETQLTTNSSEAPVTAAAISPDGKYVAYADLTGIHVRVIDSGETHTIEAREIGDVNRLGWFPDSARVVVSGIDAAESAVPSIWSVPILGGSPRKLRVDAMEASVSPDGLQIAFVDGARKTVWVMGGNGEDPHQVLTRTARDDFYLPSFWFKDTRIAYGRTRLIEEKKGLSTIMVSLELRGPDGHTATLLSDPGLRGATLMPDGRLVYALVAEPALNRGASLWEVDTDSRTGVPTGKPRRLHDWMANDYVLKFTSSSDATRVVFLKQTPQQDVDIADLSSGGDLISPRRFTLDDSNDFPTNWTPDSKAILFTSDRNGSYDIFRQALDQRTPEAIVSGPDDESGPTGVTPDGAWFYYIVAPKKWRAFALSKNTLMRRAASGGLPQQIGEPRLQWASCAQLPATNCVLVEQDGKQRVTVYALDPVQGRGRMITSSEMEYKSAYYPSALSPDGTRVAFLMPIERRMRIVSLEDGSAHDVPVADRPLDSQVFFWSISGNGWYVSSPSSAGADLLYLDSNGRARVVSHQPAAVAVHGIPSPDGRHIALTYTTTISNVWMMNGSDQ